MSGRKEPVVYTCRKITQRKPCMKDAGHRGKCSPWIDDNPRFADQLDPRLSDKSPVSPTAGSGGEGTRGEQFISDVLDAQHLYRSGQITGIALAQKINSLAYYYRNEREEAGIKARMDAIMATKARHIPVGACDSCGQRTHSHLSLGLGCFKRLDNGKDCTGIFRSTLEADVAAARAEAATLRRERDEARDLLKRHMEPFSLGPAGLAIVRKLQEETAAFLSRLDTKEDSRGNG